MDKPDEVSMSTSTGAISQVVTCWKYFQYTFYLLLRLVGIYQVHWERCQSSGRVDCVVEMEGHVYIFEF